MQRQLPANYSVRFKHFRNRQMIVHPDRLDAGTMPVTIQIAPKGGATLAKIYDAEGNHVITGVAYCNPKDQFNKKTGRTIALGRALADLEIITSELKVEERDQHEVH